MAKRVSGFAIGVSGFVPIDLRQAGATERAQALLESIRTLIGAHGGVVDKERLIPSAKVMEPPVEPQLHLGGPRV